MEMKWDKVIVQNTPKWNWNDASKSFTSSNSLMTEAPKSQRPSLSTTMSHQNEQGGKG